MKKYICFILFSLFSIVSFGQKGHEHRVSGMTATVYYHPETHGEN